MATLNVRVWGRADPPSQIMGPPVVGGNLAPVSVTETMRVRSNTVSVILGTTGQIAFYASPEHATNVDSYEARLRPAGSGTVSATQNMGKPTPDGNNVIIYNLASFFAAQPAGNYTLSVAAVNAFGAGDSVPSTPFALPIS